MKKNIILILIILAIFISGLTFAWRTNKTEIKENEQKEEVIRENYNANKKDCYIGNGYSIKKNQLFSLEAGAAISALVAIGGDAQILFEKNPNEKLSIASLSKLMTAYVVLKYYDLSHIIEISEQAISQPGSAGKLTAGQKISVKDLLFSLLIPSCNDSAYALAETIGQNHFVFLMNKEAKNLGLKNTYFVNPTGLNAYGINNYSTANELIKFIEYLLFFDEGYKDKLFWSILSTKEINLYEQKLISTNQLLGRVPGVVGGRTGWTPRAGGSLVLAIKTPKGYLINIILGTLTPESRFKEMFKMVNWVKSEQKGEIGYKWDPGKTFLNWKEETSNAPWGKRDSHYTIVFQDKLWLFGGLSAEKDFSGAYGNLPHKSDIWTSKDGKNWQLITSNAPWGERRSLQIVEFKEKLWLIGGWEKGIGSRNDIWSSDDGINWIRKVSSTPWPVREGHTVLVFNNKIWLFGGVDFAQRKIMNDVWYSKDGIIWNQTTLNIPWTPRYDHTTTVFRDKIWLTGGMAFNKMLKDDIWTSKDGKNWQLITDNASWGKRHGHTSIVFQDKLWIISGFNSQGGLNDVWYSKDGAFWQSTLVNNKWAGREDHTSTVFQDKIWIMGGMSDNWIWKSDVWHSVF